MWFGVILCEDFEFPAVVSVQTILGANPDKSLAVLKERSDISLRQAIFDGNHFGLY
jgi:hypothetical protein